MSLPQPAQPAKLVISLLFNDKSLFEPVARALVAEFGVSDFISAWMPFDYTTYYTAEMGSPLVRRLLGFRQLIQQENLSAVKLITNAIEGNTSYDWAVFGDPLLVDLTPSLDYTQLPAGTAGVAIATIECPQSAQATVSMGSTSVELALSPGRHIVPLHFTEVAPVSLDVNSGVESEPGMKDENLMREFFANLRGGERSSGR